MLMGPSVSYHWSEESKNKMALKLLQRCNSDYIGSVMREF